MTTGCWFLYFISGPFSGLNMYIKTDLVVLSSRGRRHGNVYMDWAAQIRDSVTPIERLSGSTGLSDKSGPPFM